jgi:hypothetical protein
LIRGFRGFSPRDRALSRCLKRRRIPQRKRASDSGRGRDFRCRIACAGVRNGAGGFREMELPEEVWGRVESGKEDELKERCPLY